MSNKEPVIVIEDPIKKVYYQKDLVDLTSKSLQASGIVLSETVIKMVIENYVETKKAVIEAGNSIDEPSIGTWHPAWRRVSGAFAKGRRFTSKVKFVMDDELKEMLNRRIESDPSFRTYIGADDLDLGGNKEDGKE